MEEASRSPTSLVKPYISSGAGQMAFLPGIDAANVSASIAKSQRDSSILISSRSPLGVTTKSDEKE